MGVAAWVAAWDAEWNGRYDWSTPQSAGTPPITYPSVPLRIKVELLLAGEWVDITSGPNGIYYETRIRIKRGRDSENTRAQPSSCKIRLKNPSRWWSPRNPASPYYGKLGRNIKMRVIVNPGDRDYTRFTGYVSKWPQEWTRGDHRWVNLEANGILRRLSQGKAPIKSPILRAITSQNPYAYWPLNETSDATEAASMVTDGGPLVPTPTGSISFAGFTDTPSGANAPAINSGALVGSVSPVVTGNSDGWIIGFGMKMISMPLTPDIGRSVITVFLDGADIAKIDWLPPTEDAGLPFQPVGYASDGITNFFTMNGSPFYASPAEMDTEYDNKWHYYQLVARRTGTSLALSTYFDGTLIQQLSGLALSSPTAGNVTSVHINPTFLDFSSLNLSFSEISALPVTTINEDADAFNMYIGESPTDRFRRLCEQEGVPYVIVETEPDTEAMGPQGTKNLMDLLRECEATNEGVIDETFTGELRLISRSAFFNQPPAMQIDYNAGAIQEGFLPTDDDLLLRNDWTVTRSGGNSRQWVQSEGPLNVNDPEDDANGVSRYDDSVTLSLETDDQAMQHAAYRVGKGTVDDMRVAKMPLHFGSIAGRALLASWLQMDLANTSRFWIKNTPSDIGGETLDQNMTGYEETIDRLEWKTDISGVPATLEQQYGVLDFLGWIDCDQSFLAEDLDTTETAIDVQMLTNDYWFHDEGDYRVKVRAEEMIVTAVSVPVASGDGWTQTLTVSRSANGVVLTHPAGTQVNVVDPFVPLL